MMEKSCPECKGVGFIKPVVEDKKVDKRSKEYRDGGRKTDDL